MPTTTSTYVRVTDLDDIDGTRPPITCRVAELAETVLEAGWFDTAPQPTRDTLYALQAGVQSGACTDGLQRQLGVSVEPAPTPGAGGAGAGVPLPAGAEDADDWESFDTPGGASRLVVSPLMPLPAHLAGHFRVRVAVVQRGDGSLIAGSIEIVAGDGGYSPADARLLAQALIDAADTADRWRAQAS